MLNKIKIINAKGVDNLNTKNLVALNFREDLIKLLEKYDCEISGTRIDDECINLEINFCFGSYTMQDSYNNYNITKKSGSKYENIIDSYILKHFPEHSSTMRGLNNIKIHTGIFTFDFNILQNRVIPMTGVKFEIDYEDNTIEKYGEVNIQTNFNIDAVYGKDD